MLDYNAIVKILPHRPPFLLIDCVTHVEQQEVRAYKLLGAGEPFFPGHFPDHPVMPGVLQLEALAQTAAVWMGVKGQAGQIAYLTGVQAAKFRKPVTVGDRLDLCVKLEACKGGFYRFTGQGQVGQDVVCEATLTACVAPQKNTAADCDKPRSR